MKEQRQKTLKARTEAPKPNRKWYKQAERERKSKVDSLKGSGRENRMYGKRNDVA